MTINANDKIVNAIEGQLPLNEAIKKEGLRNERAIELFYTLPSFYEEKQMLKKWRREYLQYGIDSYTYSSELIVLKSYMVLNGEYVIDQTIVMSSLDNTNPIASIRTKLEWKALQQFLMDTELGNAAFGYPTNNNEDRNIEVTETGVIMGGRCIGDFTRIKKKGTDTVYLEKYKPGSKYSAINGCNKVEILYCHDDVPVFAKIYKEDEISKDLTKGDTMDFHNSAKLIVNRISQEVDEIIDEIIIKINEKKAKDPQKKIGTYS